MYSLLLSFNSSSFLIIVKLQHEYRHSDRDSATHPSDFVEASCGEKNSDSEEVFSSMVDPLSEGQRDGGAYD